MSEPRKHTRWTDRGDKIAHLKIARDSGLRVINTQDFGRRFGLGLFGTDEQMQRTEDAWRAAGVRYYRECPKGARAVYLGTPAEAWAERTADWEKLYRSIKP